MTTKFPYPGLRPFYRHEADIFFGREEQTDKLVKKLGVNRFVGVVGPSGCGKSSLVRAGMISALETGFMASAGSRWRIALMRPGSHPLGRLAEALVNDSALGPERGGEKESASFLEATLRRGPLSMVEVLRETPLPPNTNLLIIIDQFEEIFRFRKERDSDEADAFVALALETAAQREVPAYVVITMRSDYLGDCALFAGCPEALNESQFLTSRMTREQRRAAIVGPARVFGGDVEEDLVNLLLNESGPDPSKLPVLQHLLMRMWTCTRSRHASDDRSEDPAKVLLVGDAPAEVLGHILTLSDYENVGGFTEALSKHADEAFTALDRDKQQIAEILFRCLCERESFQRDRRRPTPISEIAAQARVSPEAVIDVIEDFRHSNNSFILPTLPEPLFPNTVADISHESMIRLWKRLNKWVEQEAKSAEVYRFLEQTARLWRQGQAALWGTPNLENAIDWRARENPTLEWAKRYGENFALAIEFLDKSEQTRKTTEARKETARQHELQQAKLLAEEQRLRAKAERERAEAQTKISYQLKKRSLALFGISVLAVTALIIAIWHYQLANDQRQHSFARELSWAAKKNSARDPALSMLLSLQAVSESSKVDGSVLPEVEEALNQTIQDQELSSNLREAFYSYDTKEDTSAIWGVAFHPEGYKVATAENSGKAKVWDADSGEILHVLTGHTKTVNSVAFSRSGKHIVTGSGDATAIIWDAETGKDLRLLRGHEGPIFSVVFSPDERHIVTGSLDTTAIIWDVETGTELRTLRGHKDYIFGVAFSPDGKRIVTGSWDKTAKVWHADTGKAFLSLKGHTDFVFGVDFSPDGTRIATGSWDKTVKLWDAATGNEIRTLIGHDREVNFVAFSPDGKYLFTGGWDEIIIKWDPITGDKVQTLSEHANAVYGVAISRDQNRIVTAGLDGIIKLWDISSGKVEGQLPKNNAQINSVAVDYDGKRLLTGGYDMRAKVWDLSSGDLLFPLRGHTGIISGVAFRPNGKAIATASHDKNIILWDAKTGKKQRTLTGHSDALNEVEFSPDGKQIVSGSRDTTAIIWDAENGNVIRILSDHDGPVLGVAFSPDGKRIVTGSTDDTAKVWDAKTGKVLHILKGHSNDIFGVDFSPDGKWIVTASKDKKAIIWEAKAGKHMFALAGHLGPIIGAVFSPDGNRIATCSEDRTTKIWDVTTGLNVLTFSGHLDKITDITFNINGNQLATSSFDGTVRFHALKIDYLVKPARHRLTRSLNQDECKIYMHSEDCPPEMDAIKQLLKGRKSAGSGNIKKAITNFKKALKLDPTLNINPEAEAKDWEGITVKDLGDISTEVDSGSLQKEKPEKAETGSYKAVFRILLKPEHRDFSNSPQIPQQ